MKSNLTKYIALLAIVIASQPAWSQKKFFSRQDTLRGTITPERAWWDLVYYDLQLIPDIREKTLKGQNTIVYKPIADGNVMQIDLQPPMQVDKVLQEGKELSFTRDGNVYLITVTNSSKSTNAITVYFSGKPRISPNPPWSGGLTWKKDANGLPFVATSCQGDGASLWWPCKDHAYDEPDSMQISITTSKALTAVANGRLRGITKTDTSATYTWFVSNPINNYGVNMNIASYVHFSEKYAGKNGTLDCDYYVLPYNLTKAKKQFAQVKLMLDAFEDRFGPYPFYADGYKLVEVPYLGMEHQSSVTYGNGYQNGYLGKDLSGTGQGDLFDFIIIHESGHEWFANSITCKDIADMWIHEGFTCYSESVFLEYHHGKEAAYEYIRGLRGNIANDRPIIGVYGVNNQGSSDMYFKGANMLHTLRQWVNDDKVWINLLRDINTTFYHQTVTTQQIEGFIAEKTGKNLTAFFNQYLRDKRVPIFEYKVEGNSFKYRWANCIETFDMPLKVSIGGVEKWITPTTKWVADKVVSNEVEVNPDFYITTVIVE